MWHIYISYMIYISRDIVDIVGSMTCSKMRGPVVNFSSILRGPVTPLPRSPDFHSAGLLAYAMDFKICKVYDAFKDVVFGSKLGNQLGILWLKFMKIKGICL